MGHMMNANKHELTWDFQFFVIVGVILLLEIVAGSLILVNAEKASNLLSQSLVSFQPLLAPTDPISRPQSHNVVICDVGDIQLVTI